MPKLHPDAQFPVTQARLAALLQCYGIGEFSYQKVPTGSENLTLIIHTSGDTYALRIYRKGRKTTAEIVQEVELMQFYVASGVPAARVVKTQAGSYVAELPLNGTTWQAILMPYIQGERADITADTLLKNMAGLQAQMHLLAMQYKSRQGGWPRPLTRLHDQKFITRVDFAPAGEWLQKPLQRAQAFRYQLDPVLPTGICHLDIGDTNVVTQNHAIVGVLDFDDANDAPLAVCLAYTMTHIFYETFDLQKLRTYLAAYRAVRPLRLHEVEALQHAMLYRNYVMLAIRLLFGASPAKLERTLQLEQTFKTPTFRQFLIESST